MNKIKKVRGLNKAKCLWIMQNYCRKARKYLSSKGNLYEFKQ